MIMGDFNAKVCNGTSGKTIGPFGLGKRNERGDRLIHWCEEKGLAVMNTWFDVHPRHSYMHLGQPWRSCAQPNRLHSIQQAISICGIESQNVPRCRRKQRYHVPVVATVKLYTLIKDAQNIKTHTKVLYKCSYKEENVREQFCQAVMEGLEEFEPSASSETQWSNLKNSIVEAANKYIPREERKGSSSHWMTQEIRELMHHRRLAPKMTPRNTIRSITSSYKNAGGQGTMVRRKVSRNRETERPKP